MILIHESIMFWQLYWRISQIFQHDEFSLSRLHFIHISNVAVVIVRVHGWESGGNDKENFAKKKRKRGGRNKILQNFAGNLFKYYFSCTRVAGCCPRVTLIALPFLGKLIFFFILYFFKSESNFGSFFPCLLSAMTLRCWRLS